MCCRLERKRNTRFSHVWTVLTPVCSQFTSTRRLPSRLFSSTRRLFGSGTASPAPLQAPTSSVSPALSGTRSGSQSSITSFSAGGHPPSQQRRLAEFATILGDLKLAVNVWEALNKDGKSGSVGYTSVCGRDKSTQLFRFKGNPSTAPFSISRGNPSCHACALYDQCRSIGFGSATCFNLCCTLGGQYRISSERS